MRRNERRLGLSSGASKRDMYYCDIMSMDCTKLVLVNVEDLLEELKKQPNWEALDEEVQATVIEEFSTDVGRSIIEATAKTLVPKKTKLRRKKVEGGDGPVDDVTA